MQKYILVILIYAAVQKVYVWDFANCLCVIFISFNYVSWLWNTEHMLTYVILQHHLQACTKCPFQAICMVLKSTWIV